MTDELLRALGERQARASEPEPAAVAPFEGRERQALLDAVLDELERSDAVEAPTAAPTPGPAVVVASSRFRRSAWAAMGVVTALAAALVLWLGLGRTSPTTDHALPPYAATRLDGGTATMRSADGPPSAITLRADASIDWILTPRSPVRSAVGAVIVARSPGQAPALLQPTGVTVSSEGVVRIAGPVREVLPLPPGTWSLVVVLGPPDALPRAVDEAEAGDQPWPRVAFEATILAAP